MQVRSMQRTIKSSPSAPRALVRVHPVRARCTVPVASLAARPYSKGRTGHLQCQASVQRSPLSCQARSLAPSRASPAAFRVKRASGSVPRRLGRGRAVVVQANLFDRLWRVIKAYTDGLVGSFEDPERLLDRLTDEMTVDATRMRQASAQAIGAQRQMAARANNTQMAADQWLKRAEIAVSRGQDDLAREALMRRKAIQADADRLTQQAVAQQQAVDQLTASVRMLESKIAEAKGKKETLKARAASAKSNIAIQEMIGGLRSNSASAFAAFDKMEEKVLALEAEAQGVAAMATPDALEARFAMLETGNVEDELKALKQGSRNQTALPRPRIEDFISQTQRVPDAIELELRELRQRARQ